MHHLKLKNCEFNPALFSGAVTKCRPVLWQKKIFQGIKRSSFDLENNWLT